MSANLYLALLRSRNLLRLAERRREMFNAARTEEFAEWERLREVASEAEALIGLRVNDERQHEGPDPILG